MKQTHDHLLSEARKLLELSRFPLSQKEIEELKVNDFGLNNLPVEGFTFVDLLRTERVRTTLMILLPGQSLPQHKHPSYEGEKGKEESIRVLWGTFSVFTEGDESPEVAERIPENKEPYYTAREEHRLEVCEQYSVAPNTAHWFQAGPKGAVVLAFQNRVNEDLNIFYDPASNGCPIPAEPTR